jgi:hypothetical protein
MSFKTRRKSPILRKCEDLMETLWGDGYRQQITWNLLREYIVKHCGGFRTTQQDYLGRRAEYYKSRGREGCLKTPARKGYLEKFGFMQVVNRKIIFLDHVKVDREYHRKQLQVDGVSFSLTCLQGGTENGETRENEREEREIQNEREKLSERIQNCIHNQDDKVSFGSELSKSIDAPILLSESSVLKKPTKGSTPSNLSPLEQAILGLRKSLQSDANGNINQ